MVARLPKAPHGVWFTRVSFLGDHSVTTRQHNRHALDPPSDPWNPRIPCRAVRVVTRRRNDGLEAGQPPAQAS